MNYLKPITRVDIDLHRYEQKFKIADAYIEGKVDLEQSWRLFADTTIFAYLNFKDNAGKPLRLYPWQDLIASDPHRFLFARCANQIGKSFFLDVKEGINLLMDHGKAHTAAIVSKSLPQAHYQMRRIKALLSSMKMRWKEPKDKSSDSLSVIEVTIREKGKFKYKNTLIVAPCTEGLLGYDLDSLNLDEFEYWEDVDKGIEWFYNQIAEPRTYHTKGKITILSNPNGMESYGAQLENAIMPDGTKKFHTYVFDFMDDPTHNEQDLELAKAGKDRQYVESTLLAIRSISDKNYFTQEEIDRSFDKDLTELKMIHQQPFFFLDVGSKHDQSFLVGGFIGYPDGEDNLAHVYIPIFHAYPKGYPISRVVGSFSEGQDSDGWHYEKSVRDYLKEWSVDGVIPEFGCDVTGNSGISPLFESAGIFPTDVVFSGPAKSGMYQRFKYCMEKGLLHRIRNKEFEFECSHLVMKRSSRGYMQIHHENEDELDDAPDSVAGLIFLMLPYELDLAPASMKIIGGEEEKKEPEKEVEKE